MSPIGGMVATMAREKFLHSIGSDTPFYRLFDLVPDVSFFARDRQFRLMCASQRFIERFGFRDEAQVIGSDDFALFPSRLADTFRRNDEELMRRGQLKPNIGELFFNEQGIPDWFVTNKLPVRDRRGGRIIGVMGTVQSYEGRREGLQLYRQLDLAVAYNAGTFSQRRHRGRVGGRPEPVASPVASEIRRSLWLQSAVVHHQAAHPGRLRRVAARKIPEQ